MELIQRRRQKSGICGTNNSVPHEETLVHTENNSASKGKLNACNTVKSPSTAELKDGSVSNGELVVANK